MIINKNKGFSFIDVLVGTSLFLIVFAGIFASYQLGLRVIGQSKNKISATAIGNELMEKIRNLSYSSVGTVDAVLPFAVGVLEPFSTSSLNGTEYSIYTTVRYVSDPADGTGEDDTCDLDYKKAEIIVSWGGRLSGEEKFVTNVAPKDVVEEVNSCEEQPGGILSVSVFDAYAQMVPSPLIQIFDPDTNTLIDSYTPASGEHSFPLATSSYKVVVSKGSDYITDRTYGIEEIATPDKPHPLIQEGQKRDLSLSIDKISSFSIDTFSTWGRETFFDAFNDFSKTSDYSNVVITNGEVILATNTEGYITSGYLISNTVVPTNISNWEEFSFNDSEEINSDLKYQFYYASGTEWFLVPNDDLNGNDTGFDLSPVNLSFLSSDDYDSLRIKASFLSNATDSTPILEDWQISWITDQPTRIPDVSFYLRGDKEIGTDADEDPVYKYEESLSTNMFGHLDVDNLEWDLYTFTINPAENLDLIEMSPEEHPVDLPPNTNMDIELYLDAENSLLLTVENLTTLEPVFSASTTVSNAGLSYLVNQHTDSKGQTYFIPLNQATYNIQIDAEGYLATSTTVYVNGDVTKTIKLEQVE